jgi:hypothetical protein
MSLPLSVMLDQALSPYLNREHSHIHREGQNAKEHSHYDEVLGISDTVIQLLHGVLYIYNYLATNS